MPQCINITDKPPMLHPNPEHGPHSRVSPCACSPGCAAACMASQLKSINSSRWPRHSGRASKLRSVSLTRTITHVYLSLYPPTSKEVQYAFALPGASSLIALKQILAKDERKWEKNKTVEEHSHSQHLLHELQFGPFRECGSRDLSHGFSQEPV